MDSLLVTPKPQSKKVAYIISAIVLVAAVTGVLAAYRHQSVATNLVASPSLESTLLSDLFSQWKLTYQKSYSTEEEEAHRFQTFQDNYAFIVNWNADTTQTSKVGLNKFADLNTAEFGALQHCLSPMKERIPTPGIIEVSIVDLPDFINWQTAGAVTSVKNQGQCGSCWAFSAAGGLEGLFVITGWQLMSFSEQQMIDCSDSFGNDGCNGGLPDQAYAYSVQYGNQLASAYPYTGTQGSCEYSDLVIFRVSTTHVDVTPNNWTALAQAVTLNPVSVLIEADQPVFQLYTSGIISSASCGTTVDHAVLVTGYATGADSGTWYVKNSWGADWGQSGYVQIAMAMAGTGQGICGIYTMPSYPQ
jgi:C1A family cysteine protease